MAISSSKYVGSRSDTGTAQVGLVSYGNAGLVITGADMGETEEPSLVDKRTSYMENGAIVSLSTGEVSALFGKNSPEYHFATGYFGYVAPNGLFPEILYFKKCNSANLVEEYEAALNQPTDFGSFTFLSIPDDSTSTANDIDQLYAVASTNSASETRKMFVINYKKQTGNEAELTALEKVADDLSSIRGCCLVYGATDWSSFMPMSILAAQNIVTSGVLQFMFNRFVPPVADLDVPTVTSDRVYERLATANVNFLGRTQVNGQQLDFFQRGYATNGEDLTLQMVMNWIEQQTRAGVMNLFINRVMPAAQSSVDAVENVLRQIMISAKDSGIVVPIQEVTDSIHKQVVSEIINGMGGALRDVETIEADLTINGYGFYVKLNGKKNLGNISGGHVEPSISYKVIYSYAGAIRYVGGEYKVTE